MIMETKISLFNVLSFVQNQKSVTPAVLREKFQVFAGNPQRNRDLDFLFRCKLLAWKVIDKEKEASAKVLVLAERAIRFLALPQQVSPAS